MVKMMTTARYGKNNCKLRQDHDPDGLRDAEDKRAHHGAPDVAQPADGDDEKGLDDDGVIHAERDADGRGHQGSAQAGQQAPQDKGEREDPAHVDADGPHHFPVHRRRPGDLAEFGLAREEPKAHRHQRADQEEKKIVPREGRAEHGDGPLEERRRYDRAIVRPPGHFGQVAQDEHEGEGEQQQHEMLALV